MAGDNNPWRDIFSHAEWQTIVANASAPLTPSVQIGTNRAPTWRVATPTNSGRVAPANPTAQLLSSIGREVQNYHAIPKDDHTRYSERRTKLLYIKSLCEGYLQKLGTRARTANKTVGGKQLTDPLEVWVNSLARRAAKKEKYLETMEQWEKTAKTKYKSKNQLIAYLFGLAQDNVRDGGEFLHATAYATIEKFDPYHRQTFVFLGTDSTGTNITLDARNRLGEIFCDYLMGRAANTPDPATNSNASFYEWLEYHPFCVGTPNLTGGYDPTLLQTNRVSYGPLDLAYVRVRNQKLESVRLLSGGANPPQLLNTSTFPVSHKGPSGGAAFVWDRDGHLLMHEHGYNGFVHASAKKGKKIRCSGMIRVVNGEVEVVTDESGHYAPQAKQIYHFVNWLYDGSCLDFNARVKICYGSELRGEHDALDFLATAMSRFGAAPNVPYH